MKHFIVALMLMLMIFSTTAFAEKDRGGGSPKEQSFMANFSQGMNRLQQIAIAENDVTSLLAKFFGYWWPMVSASDVNKIKIEFTNSPLILDGVTKTAINHPSKWLIQVNETEWNKLSTSDREALAVHEVLGILCGNDDYQHYYDDSGYGYSSYLKTDTSQSKMFKSSASYLIPGKAHTEDPQRNARSCAIGYKYAENKAMEICKMANFTLCELKQWGTQSFFLDDKGQLNCVAWANVEGKALGSNSAPVSSKIGMYSDILRQLSTTQLQIQFQKVLVPGGIDLFHHEYAIQVNKSSAGYIKTAPKRFCIEDCAQAQNDLNGQTAQNILIHAQCSASARKDNCKNNGSRRKAQALEVYIESLN